MQKLQFSFFFKCLFANNDVWKIDAMCLKLLRDKFVLAGIFIYILPSLIFWFGSWIYIAMHPNPWETGYGGWNAYPMTILDLFCVFGVILVLLVSLFWLPPFFVVRWWYIMIPYFAVAYGLLYYFYQSKRS